MHDTRDTLFFFALKLYLRYRGCDYLAQLQEICLVK